MNLRRPITFFIISVMVSISLLLTNCGKSSSAKVGNPAKTAALDSVAVKTTSAQRQDIIIKKTFSGSLEGEEQANIVAKISERITSINVDVGSMVKAGQVLVNLDKTGPSSQYYQAQANFTNAEKNLQRMQAIYDKGAISLQSLDAAQTAYDIAKANLEAARSEVELTSPINGVVTAVNPNVGDLATPGAPLVTVAKISSMKIIFDASEAEVQHLQAGRTVRVYSEFKPGIIAEGRITLISRSADVNSRSFEVRARFPNTADRWFKPGMFCKAEIQLISRRNAVAIPNAAIINEGQDIHVFVVQNDTAYSRQVQTGISDGSVTEIVQGLQPGEQVVTEGINYLKDATPVMIAASNSPANNSLTKKD